MSVNCAWGAACASAPVHCFFFQPRASQIDTHFLNLCNLSLGLGRPLRQPRKSHERCWPPSEAPHGWAYWGPQTLPLMRGVDRHFHSRAEGHPTTPRMRIDRPGGLEGSIGALRRIQHAGDGPRRRPALLGNGRIADPSEPFALFPANRMFSLGHRPFGVPAPLRPPPGRRNGRQGRIAGEGHEHALRRSGASLPHAII